MSSDTPTKRLYPTGPNRTLASRLNASCGGEARAARYEPLILSEWASKGGKAVLEKYGREHFIEMRKKRSIYEKHRAQRSKDLQAEGTERYNCALKKMRSTLARVNGHKGGVQRAKLFGPKCRQAMAREGGIATRNRYGKEFFREIRKKRTYYPKGYMTKKTKQRMYEDCIKNANTTHWALKELWLAVAQGFES
jgi:hypothetical protein